MKFTTNANSLHYFRVCLIHQCLRSTAGTKGPAAGAVQQSVMVVKRRTEELSAFGKDATENAGTEKMADQSPMSIK